jgi:CheY-like chemotaxis protein
MLLEDALVSPMLTQRWNRWVPYDRLYEEASDCLRFVTLKFYSPTTLERSGFPYPLPDPCGIFLMEMFHEVLRESCEVAVATTGKDGLDRALMVPGPDLILLDVTMPDKNGYEVCCALKENESCRNIPVIFMTAESDMAAETKGLEVGGVGWTTFESPSTSRLPWRGSGLTSNSKHTAIS